MHMRIWRMCGADRRLRDEGRASGGYRGFMWTTLSAVAWAGAVTLGPSSDLDGAAQRLAEVTGRPIERAQMRSVGDWSSSLPVTFDGGQANGCFGGSVSAEQFEASLRVIERPTIEERPEVFIELFHRLEAELACLSEPVAVGRFFVAKARHALAQGDAGVAQQALGDAKAMGVPAERIPAELADLFEAITPPQGVVPVRLLPYPEAVWVDGVRITHGEEGASLPLGRHLITLRGTRTTSVDLRIDGPGTLVAPGPYDDGVLGELDVPYRERAMAELVALSAARAVWLSDGVSVWKATHHGVRDLTGPPRRDAGAVRRPGDDVVCLPGGSFLMGDDEGPRPARPQHVAYVDAFCVLDHPVTQAEYLALTGLSPSSHPACPTCPVETVSWSHAASYANALSRSQGLDPAYDDGVLQPEANGWRLPTEAEWEFAARGGQPHRFAGHNEATAVGWVDVEHPQPVCTKPRNGFGLCDMTGNVREWTATWSHPYSDVPAVNPLGPDEGHLRITRGGSWKRDADAATVTYRSMTTPTSVSGEVGFRLVRTR